VTITLQVQEVVQNPDRFVKRWRLTVVGALLLSDDEFRIYQAYGDDLDETLWLEIDDSLAAGRIRDVLPQPQAGTWWYFGQALVEAWTRLDTGGWVLHEVVHVWLTEGGAESQVSIKIRPHPWGWDQFL
jgi:hypothetical protein